jgi:hypothetical protein
MTKHVVLLLLAACATNVEDSKYSDDFFRTDPWPVLDRIEREGPPRFTSRVHSCSKVRYRTLGNMLASRGVNLTATDPLSAGAIYTTGAAALAAPNYAQRVREHVETGLATESKVFDIFVQAAPEIIANMPNRVECQKNGVGARLFDTANHCQIDGISCLIGMPARQMHVDVCNQTIARAEDVEHGKQLAVAVLAAAANTCE